MTDKLIGFNEKEMKKFVEYWSNLSPEEIKHIIDEVIDSVLDPPRLKAPLNFWAEYLLTNVLGINPECIDDEIRLRASIYLMILDLGGEKK